MCLLLMQVASVTLDKEIDDPNYEIDLIQDRENMQDGISSEASFKTGNHGRRLTDEASVKTEMEAYDCRKAYPWILHPFKKDQGGHWLKGPQHLFFHKNTNDGVSGDNTFKILDTVQYESSYATAASRCMHICTPHIQPQSAVDAGTNPTTGAAGFDCGTDFELLMSSTSIYKSYFTFDPLGGTLTVNTATAFARIHMCYVCKATPSNNPSSTQVGIFKTEPFEIGVGDCSTQNIATKTPVEQAFILGASNEKFSIIPFTNVDSSTGNDKFGCIKEYKILSSATLPHPDGHNTIFPSSDSQATDCPDLAAGMACLIFRFDASAAFSNSAGRYYVGANRYDGTSLNVFNSHSDNKLSVQARDDACSTATMQCKFLCGTSTATYMGFVEPTTDSSSSTNYLDNWQYAHEFDCGTHGGGDGYGSWFFKSSDQKNCPLKMVKLYADNSGGMMVTITDFSKHALLMDAKYKYSDSNMHQHLRGYFGNIKINKTSTWGRNFYLRGYNSYGNFAQCEIEFGVCGDETVTVQSPYADLSTPYVHNIPKLDMIAGTITVHTITNDEIFNSAVWKFNGIPACYKQFPDEQKIWVYAWGGSIAASTATPQKFKKVRSNNPEYLLTFTVVDTEVHTLETLVKLTTQGGIGPTYVRMKFIVASNTGGNVDSASSSNSPIAISNTLASLGLTRTFQKATYMAKFTTSLNTDIVSALVLGEANAAGSIVASTIVSDSAEDDFIKIDLTGNFVVDLSKLPNFTVAKNYMLTAQLVSGNNGITHAGSTAAGSYIDVCIPPYIVGGIKTTLTVTYDTGDDTGITWTHQSVTSPSASIVTEALQASAITKTQLNALTFTQPYTIKFGAMGSNDIASNVDIAIAQNDNTNVFAQLSLNTAGITTANLGTLIDTLSSSTRTHDGTYNIHLVSKPKSTVTDYNGKDFSQANWQSCKFYQLWQLQIVAVQNDIFYLTSATDNVISTYNTATELGKTHTITWSTLLAKFTASCGGSCANPLNSIKLVTISTAADGSTTVSGTPGLGMFLKADSITSTLVINFANLVNPSYPVDKRYAIKGVSSGSQRNTMDHAQKTHQNGYILDVCIPPYISTALNPITVTVVQDPSSDKYDYTYSGTSTAAVSKTAQAKATFQAASLVYTLPTVRFADKSAAWVGTNVRVEISGDPTTGTAVKLNTAFSADGSGAFSMTITNMHDVINTLTSSGFTQASTAYTMTIKTSLKPAIVDSVDYSKTKWSTCVHYTTLAITFQASSSSAVYLTSASDNVYSSTNGPSDFTASDTVTQATGLSKFKSSQATDAKQKLILGQINSAGALIASGIAPDSQESNFIKIDSSGNLVINYSLMHTFTIAKRYALSVQLVSGRNGITNPYTSHANGYIFEICVPPYFSTKFDDLTLSLAYSTSAVNYTFSSGSISETGKTFTELNAATFSYALPAIKFGSYDSTWVASNVQVAVSNTNSVIAQYLTFSGFTLNLNSINDLLVALSSSTKVLASTDYTITLISSLKKQTVGTMDYSTTKWQECIFYQNLKLTIVSTYTEDVVAATSTTTSTNTATTIKTKFNATTWGDPEPEAVDCTKYPNDAACGGNTFVPPLEFQLVKEPLANVEVELPDPVINITAYEPFELQSNFGDVVLKKPSAATKQVKFEPKFDSTGGLTVKFNQPLLPSNVFKEYGKKDLNNTKEGRCRRLEDEDKIMKLVDIGYKKDPTAGNMDDDEEERQNKFVVKFNEVPEDGKSVKFSLVFDRPEEISNDGGLFKDSLNIAINKKYFKELFCQPNGEFLKFEEEQAMKIKYDVGLPLQAPPSDSAQFKAFEQQAIVADGQFWFTIIQVALNYLMQAAFSEIWSAAYALQLITYLTLINMIYPQCTSDLFEVLISLAAFDLVPEDYYTPVQEWLLPLPSDYGLTYAFIELGYETGNIMVTMFFVLFLVALQTVYYIIFFLVYKITKRGMFKWSKLNKYSKSCLVDRYSFYQRCLLGCCLEIFVSGFIEVSMRQAIDPYEKASYFLSVFLIMISYLYCHKILSIFNEDYFKMKNTDVYPVFNNKWKVVWEDIRGESDNIQPFQVFFIVRRVIYASIITLIPIYTPLNAFMQYFMVVMLNLYSCGYNAQHKPFEDKGHNLTEIFNEWVNLTVSSWFLVSMVAIPENDNDKLYQIGLMTNYLVLGMIAINIFFVFSNMVKDARLNYQRKKNLKKEKEMYQKLWEEALEIEKKQKKEGTRDFKKERQASRKVEELQEKLEEIEKLQSCKEEEEEIEDQLIEDSVDQADKLVTKDQDSQVLQAIKDADQLGMLGNLSRRKNRGLPKSLSMQKRNKKKDLAVIDEDSKEQSDDSSSSSSDSQSEKPNSKNVAEKKKEPQVPDLLLGETTNLGDTQINKSKITAKPKAEKPKPPPKPDPFAPNPQAAAIKAKRQAGGKYTRKKLSKADKLKKSLE